MPIAQKLKWQRSLSKLRFCHEEVSLIKEIARDASGEFQQYYEKYCAENALDIKKLNEENKSRIKELYGVPPQQDSTAEEISPGNLETFDMALHLNPTKQETPEHFEGQDAEDVHIAFSKLFKKIAIILHPDKISHSESDEAIHERKELFQKANNALKNKKYFVLLDIAERYKVATPKNYDQQTRWMKKEIETIEGAIHREKQTYNYLFSEAEAEEQKQELIKKFIYQVFRINTPQSTGS